MKKTALFFLLLMLSANLAHSQVLIALLLGDKLNSDKFEMGIRLAGNWGGLTGMEGANSRFALGFGIYGTFKMSDKFSIQPEFLFKEPRGAEGLSPEVFDNPSLDPLLADAKVAMKLAYFALPVLFKYSLNPNLSFGFGPQVGYLRSAQNVYVAEVYAKDDLVFKDNIKSGLNKFDFALAFNLEYKLQKRGIHIGLRYYLGLTDIVKDNPGGSIKNSVIQINLGIPMGGKKKAQKADPAGEK